LVGNDPPEIKIELTPNNLTYWNHKKVHYKVSVVDKQDGSTAAGTIDPSLVKVTLDYIPEGADMVKATLGHQKNTTPAGKKIIDGSDCKACHAAKVKVNGPSYKSIAEKYTTKDTNYLVSKIIKGGSGVWGETMMSAHPQLEVKEVEKVVKYILSLKETKKKVKKGLPIEGTLEFKEHMATDGAGMYVLIASYHDKGNAGQKDSELSAREQVIFKAPKIEAEKADEKSAGLNNWKAGGATLVGSIVHNSYLKFNKVTLNGLKSIEFSAFFTSNYNYKGSVEIREGAATGKVIGKADLSYFNEKKGKMNYYKIKVRPTVNEGLLYLVFKNKKDKEKYIANANWILLNY